MKPSDFIHPEDAVALRHSLESIIVLLFHFRQEPILNHVMVE